MNDYLRIILGCCDNGPEIIERADAEARKIEALERDTSRDAFEARRMGISVEQYRAKLAEVMAEDTRRSAANPILPAPDAEHYESARPATNRGGW